ncbi:MAG: methyl-accepting chemotaxis protein [Lachnospiraceae bacterium]|nr:methyl-accepting chemotaxis protein [Lachnospiraceae bacterium]
MKGKTPKNAAPKKAKPKQKAVNFKQVLKNISGKGIMRSLMLIAILPVLLMIVLGFVSYQTAANAILNQCKDSAMATVDASADYLSVVCGSVSSKGAELVTHSTIKNYYQNYDRADSAYADMYTEIQSLMGQMKIANEYLFSYSIIPDQGKSVTSLTGTLPDDYYALFEESPEGSFFKKNKAQASTWMGYHPFVDENLKTKSSNYAFAYIQKIMQTGTVLVLDIDMAVVENMLTNLDTGDGSIKALVSADGREIGTIQGQESFYNTGDADTHWFVGNDYYIQSRENNASESKTVRLQGKEYVYLYAPVGNTGISLCVLVPQSSLLKDAGTIAYVTFFIVLFAGAIALFTGIVIARGIRSTVKHLVNGLKEAEKGNLSVHFTTKRKDEFLLLTNSLNNTLLGIRSLFEDTQRFGEQVNDMSSELAERTSSMNESMQEILRAVEEVANGTQTQAEETDASNQKMIELSENITETSHKTQTMESLADEVMDAVDKGQTIVDGISKNADATVEITRTLTREIQDVNNHSIEIRNIVNVIDGIAGQTNLLSLNASIEAARAGTLGRGFAVVAEEIRKLADQSKESSNQIQEIIQRITEATERTTLSAAEAEQRIHEQVEQFRQTVAVFTSIKDCAEALIDELNLTVANMKQVDLSKDEVSDSIRNIAAVSEQAAASIQEVTATLNNQTQLMEYLTNEANALTTQTSILNTSMEKFIIS